MAGLSFPVYEAGRGAFTGLSIPVDEIAFVMVWQLPLVFRLVALLDFASGFPYKTQKIFDSRLI